MFKSIDKFLIFTFLAVVLAYVFPELGSSSNKFILDKIATVGIAFIFFFYGLKLSFDKIKAGLKNWKLHLVIQTTTFLVFPLVVLPFYPLVKTAEGFEFWLSFLFLAALPSTVSTSVVMVSIAKGNLPAAIFNASISGLIGVLITPLWIGLFIAGNDSVNYNMGHIYFSLFLEIILPVALGLLLQRKLGKYTNRYLKEMSIFDKSIILLIIYKSFAEAFEANVFEAVGWLYLFLVLTVSALFFFLIYFYSTWISNYLSFNREDKITAQFCGTKKSLVHGTVFSEILIPPTFSMGIIILPIMLFHALQIFIVTIIANKMASEANTSL